MEIIETRRINLKEKIENKGYTLASPLNEYFTQSDRITIKCKKCNTDTIIEARRFGRFECSCSRKNIKFETVKKYITDRGAILISIDYKDTCSKLSFECTKCGNEYKRTFTSFKKQKYVTCCQSCADEDIKLEIKKKENNRKLEIVKDTPLLLSIDGKNAKSICIECNKVFSQNLYAWRKKKKNICQKCSSKTSGPSIKTEEFLLKIKEHNLELLEEYKGTRYVYKFQCSCGEVFERKANNMEMKNTYLCSTCSPKSKLEDELFIFIRSVDSRAKHNDRSVLKGFEIDVLVKEQNIGFEFNGLYYHTEKMGKDKNYHLNKTTSSKKQGIRLIHIFENEWIDKKSIVKSMISNRLKANNRSIYGRKCIIKEIDSKTRNIFLEKNHLQGKDRANISLGLFYENELVSVMTFIKSRFNKNYEWELSRFCNVLNTSVIGGGSKLLKYFEINFKPNSLITYADRRYSEGDLYYNLGFNFKHYSPPNYKYYKSGKLFTRQHFQKHKLEGKLDIFDPLLSESANMEINNYSKIWDCGNMAFIKNYK